MLASSLVRSMGYGSCSHGGGWSGWGGPSGVAGRATTRGVDSNTFVHSPANAQNCSLAYLMPSGRVRTSGEHSHRNCRGYGDGCRTSSSTSAYSRSCSSGLLPFPVGGSRKVRK